MLLYLIRRRLKVLKSDNSTQAKVTMNLKPGPATPAMMSIWKKWWAARIAEVKQSEAKNER